MGILNKSEVFQEEKIDNKSLSKSILKGISTVLKKTFKVLNYTADETMGIPLSDYLKSKNLSEKSINLLRHSSNTLATTLVLSSLIVGTQQQIKDGTFLDFETPISQESQMSQQIMEIELGKTHMRLHEEFKSFDEVLKRVYEVKGIPDIEHLKLLENKIIEKLHIPEEELYNFTKEVERTQTFKDIKYDILTR